MPTCLYRVTYLSTAAFACVVLPLVDGALQSRVLQHLGVERVGRLILLVLWLLRQQIGNMMLLFLLVLFLLLLLSSGVDHGLHLGVNLEVLIADPNAVLVDITP